MDSSQGGKLPSSKSNMSYLGSFGLQRAMFVLAHGAAGAGGHGAFIKMYYRDDI